MQNARFVTDFFFCFFQLPDVVVDFTKGGGIPTIHFFSEMKKFPVVLKKKWIVGTPPPCLKMLNNILNWIFFIFFFCHK